MVVVVPWGGGDDGALVELAWLDETAGVDVLAAGRELLVVDGCEPPPDDEHAAAATVTRVNSAAVVALRIRRRTVHAPEATA